MNAQVHASCMVQILHKNKYASKSHGVFGVLVLIIRTHLISWTREILRGDMAGLVSDFLLSESRSMPRSRRTEFSVSENHLKILKINVRRR